MNALTINILVSRTHKGAYLLCIQLSLTVALRVVLNIHLFNRNSTKWRKKLFDLNINFRGTQTWIKQIIIKPHPAHNPKNPPEKLKTMSYIWLYVLEGDLHGLLFSCKNIIILSGINTNHWNKKNCILAYASALTSFASGRDKKVRP